MRLPFLLSISIGTTLCSATSTSSQRTVAGFTSGLRTRIRRVAMSNRKVSNRFSAINRHDISDVADELVRLVRNQLQPLAKPQKAKSMQKYLKTDMPMYGVPRPQRVGIEKSACNFLAKSTGSNSKMSLELYLAIIKTMWSMPMREEKYLAIDLAIHYKDCITIEALPLYEEMLRENYMWWDLADPIAVHLAGQVASMTSLQRWIRDDNLWIRRSAILAQLKYKETTDEALLFQLCRFCMHEKEFFIRKAIGWALREYSKTAPHAVKEFLETEKANLSGLSYREGAKVLLKRELM